MSLFGPRPPGSRDRMAFTEQLALLLETGMPLHTALHTMSNQAGSTPMRSIINDLAADIESGQRFATAISRHPALFSTTYVSLISAAEGSGFLPKVLEQLVAEDEKREELRKTVVSALTYPAFLIAFSLFVVLFVLVVVFPKFSAMFAKIHDQLPGTTLALMWCSEHLRDYWWEVSAVGLATGFLVYSWIRSPAGRATIDRLKLTLPGVRVIFIQLYITQSFRVLGLSLAHGVSISDALEVTRDVVDNQLFRGLLRRVEQSVREGGTIAAGFADVAYVPDLAREMVATAEVSGNLARVFSRVAAHYERDLSRRLVALSKMAEPVMLLVMGLIVGVIVSSLILPIFKLSRAVT
ncbi:MAG: type II secretion system F family protein [Gammaproteobacteria bacterium]|nr:type II secretion system F family protein [Gammaproteobacteria bacterium]MDH5274974.1 type II secretion system F family protein [Gammaproteobacteria bacterium]